MEQYSITENGALGYSTSGNALTDINFKVSSFRRRNEEEIASCFRDALKFDKIYAIKWMFYLRDIEEGLGERRSFRVCLRTLEEEYPEIVKNLIPLIPYYGRYDDLLSLLETEAEKEVISYIEETLKKDLELLAKKEAVSLLAKWLPSDNASSRITRKNARIIARGLGLDIREYRRILTTLRKHINIVETKITEGRYEEIDYEKVPARANLKYNECFVRNDFQRRYDYIEAAVKGENSFHITGVSPHEVVARYKEESYVYNCRKYDIFAEAIWKSFSTSENIPGKENSFLNEELSDCIVVSDCSGSMYQIINGNINAMDVSLGLGIYFSERLRGRFKDKVITFSKSPSIIDLSECKSLGEKIKKVSRCSMGYNTDIEAVFRLLLDSAKLYGMSREEMPGQVLVVSDMEFDNADIRSCDIIELKPLFESIREEYEAAGYNMPKLIFWNVCGRTDTVPLREAFSGVALISGFSQNTIKGAGKDTDLSPLQCLINVLDSDRYAMVQEAIAA